MNPEQNRTTRTDTLGIVTGTIHSPSILGIPVSYDEHLPLIADSSGLGPWKNITIGPAFLPLTDRQKGAVLLHETGHCRMWHTERLILHAILHPSVLWAILRASFLASRKFDSYSAESILWFQAEIERMAPGIGAYRRAQELAADRFAAECGYGAELAQVFRIAGSRGAFHPSMEERIAALQPTPKMAGI